MESGSLKLPSPQISLKAIRHSARIVTTVRGGGPGLTLGVALDNGRRYQRADWTLGFASRYLPIKAVVLAFVAEDPACVERHANKTVVPSSSRGRVPLLRTGISLVQKVRFSCHGVQHSFCLSERRSVRRARNILDFVVASETPRIFAASFRRSSLL